MEYLAKILGEERINIKLWKYDFLDVQSNQTDYFYHHKQINCKPNLTGTLELTRDKFFKSFKRELIDTDRKGRGEQSLTDFERQSISNIEKIANDHQKKQIKLSVEPHHLKSLRQIGISYKNLATIYQRSERTIYRWFNPSLEPLKKWGKKPKITEESFSLLRAYIDNDDNPKTQQEMADYLSQQIGQRISRQAIGWWLKKNNYTHKKLTYHYKELDEIKAKVFNEEIKLLLPKFPFIALDECSFYPNLWPRFGYSLKGTRAVSKRPGHKGKHYTLLFAISNLKENGVVHWELTKESVNWKIFYDFLEKINPIGDKKNYLIMDNSSVHKAPDKRMEEKLPNVEEQLARKGIEVKFITTYAPMLNPTELCFNLLRQQTEKQRPRSYKELKNAIEKVVDLFNTKDLSKCFWHCVNYFDDKKTKFKL